MGKKFRVFIVLHVITVFLLYLGNNILDVSYFEVESEKIPGCFDGYKIVQVSDLHNKSFKGRLIKRIKAESPDIIVVTGDIVYKRSGNISNSEEFIKQAVKICPVYFVTGNHEYGSKNPENIINFLNDSGVKILDNEGIELKRSEGSIFLWGICDIARYYDEKYYLPPEEVISQELSELSINKEKYNILLSHRPKYLDVYSRFGFDLVFAGHAHGGTVRLPFLGGLIGPGPTFLPKYTAGKYEQGGTTEIVSRGLGGSIFNVRVLNNPELVVCKLKSLK